MERLLIFKVFSLGNFRNRFTLIVLLLIMFCALPLLPKVRFFIVFSLLRSGDNEFSRSRSDKFIDLLFEKENSTFDWFLYVLFIGIFGLFLSGERKKTSDSLDFLRIFFPSILLCSSMFFPILEVFFFPLLIGRFLTFLSSFWKKMSES